MGVNFFDQYIYLHFATGIITYFWGITLLHWTIFHTLFEYVENTKTGMNLINQHFTFWPGGKPKPDAIINIFGDNIAAILGWVSAYYLDHLGNTYGWYTLHRT